MARWWPTATAFMFALFLPTADCASIVVEPGGAINIAGGAGDSDRGGGCTAADIEEIKGSLNAIKEHLGLMPPPPPPPPEPSSPPPPPPEPSSPPTAPSPPPAQKGSKEWRLANYATGQGGGAVCFQAFAVYSDANCEHAITGGEYSAGESSCCGYSPSNLEPGNYDCSIDNDCTSTGSTPWCSGYNAGNNQYGAHVTITFSEYKEVKCAKMWYLASHNPPDWSVTQFILQAKYNDAFQSVSGPTSTCNSVGACGVGGQWGRKMKVNDEFL